MTRRTPAQYNWDKLEFDETILTRHFSKRSKKNVKFVVVHHMTIVGKGNGSALTACYNTWQSREASAHYGIDGALVRQFVWDKDYAWATGSTVGNENGISIEHANSTAGPKWLVAEGTWKTGARLAAHLHKTYKLGRPVKDKTLRKHSSFTATACPGPHLGGTTWAQYVKEAQRVYDEITGKPDPKPTPKPKPATVKITSSIQNLAGAAANTHGVKTAKTRTQRYIKARKAVPVSTVLTQEVNTAMLEQLNDDLAGFQDGIGGNGRYIFLADGRKRIDGGVFTASKSYLDDTKQCAWIIYGTRDVLSCEGSLHLEHRLGPTPDKIRVQQAEYFADQLLAKAKKHGVPLGNVMLAGDTNSQGMVAAALAKKGWRNVAAGTRFEHKPTFIGWAGSDAERFDYAFVYDGPGATPVKAEVVAVAPNPAIADHAGLRVVRWLTK